jgi:serine/threonine protein kinase
LVGQLGEGGFGQTFLAEDLHLPGHPRCVVKQLKPQFSNLRGLETAKRLFDTEAAVLYQLGDHDQIPRLLAHFEHEQEFFLAQELIVGQPLSEELVSGQPWDEEKVVALLQDVLNVLSFVHQRGVIHRDIKPQNLIRRDRDGKVVLIDFGAVKQASMQLADPDLGATKTISIGTQGYMPNEQIAGNPRFSSDIYAIGKVAIQALIGVAPKHLQDDPQTGEVRWRYLAPQVNDDLANFLDQMVRYDFRARFVTALEALEALKQLPIYASVSPLSPPLASPRSGDSPDLPGTSPWQATTTAMGSSVAAGVTAFFSEAELANPDSPALPPTRSPQNTPGSQVPTEAVAATPPPLTLVSPSSPDSIAPPSIAASASSAIQHLFSRLKPHELVFPLAGVAAIGLLVTLVRPSLTSQSPQSPDIPAASDSTPTPLAEHPAASPSAAPPPSSSPVASPAANAEVQTTVFLAQADQLRQKGEFQQAIVLYEQVIQLNAESAEAQWGRCYSLNRLLKPQAAIEACEAALKLNPDYPEALWSKGYALELQQQPQAALSLYERAIALKPNFAEAWNNKGTALFQLGRIEEALTMFNKATGINPQFAEAWSNRGAALGSLGRYQAAAESIDRALQLQPNHEAARSLREQLRQRLGQ